VSGPSLTCECSLLAMSEYCNSEEEVLGGGRDGGGEGGGGGRNDFSTAALSS